MLCRAISAWAPAVNVSASAGKVVDSALASTARTLPRMRLSALAARAAASRSAVVASPGNAPSRCTGEEGRPAQREAPSTARATSGQPRFAWAALAAR
jgi:hypothetical protein